jgi:hypothetical protein
MKRSYLRGTHGQFAGSLARFLKIPTASKSKIPTTAQYKADDEQYIQANIVYEEWANTFLPKVHPDNHPELTYRYGRSPLGNPMIRLLKPTPSQEILSRPRQEEVDTYPVQVGAILWDRRSGEIESVGIEEEYRRQGLATELYHLAIAISSSPVSLPIPKHSVARSPEGHSWALAVGGEIPTGEPTGPRGYGRVE